MGMSAAKVLLISLFLIAGMLLPGIVWQPKGSFEVWNIMENDFPRNGSSEEKMTLQKDSLKNHKKYCSPGLEPRAASFRKNNFPVHPVFDKRKNPQESPGIFKWYP